MVMHRLLVLACASVFCGDALLVSAQGTASLTADFVGAAPSNLTGCYADPSDPKCVDFRQTDSDSLEDLDELCVRNGTSMPYMVVCSLWTACKVKSRESQDSSDACEQSMWLCCSSWWPFPECGGRR